MAVCSFASLAQMLEIQCIVRIVELSGRRILYKQKRPGTTPSLFCVFMPYRSIVTLKPTHILLLFVTTVFVYTLGLPRIIIDQVYTFPLLSEGNIIKEQEISSLALYHLCHRILLLMKKLTYQILVQQYTLIYKSTLQQRK